MNTAFMICPENAGAWLAKHKSVKFVTMEVPPERQIIRLRNAGCVEMVSDIGSGFNCKKPGVKVAFNEKKDYGSSKTHP